MARGSCLCGKVRYEADAPFEWMAHCHCSMCRKDTGGLFDSSVGVAKQQFRWLAGQDAIATYASSPHAQRCFCTDCGSSLPFEIPSSNGSRDTNTPQDSGVIGIPAGSLDDDPGIKPQAHIFVRDKSASTVINDSLPRFATRAADSDGEIVDRPTKQLKPNVVQGSCLCGSIEYEFDGLPTHMVNCHCSRCRKSRGTAHGTNCFVDQRKLRWTRGEAKLKTYKVPEARVFCTSFCSDCGGLMPASFDAVGVYLVPVGSIDTPLELQPGVNIQVGSKAPWFNVDESLPQFDAMPPRERMAEFMFDFAALKNR